MTPEQVSTMLTTRIDPTKSKIAVNGMIRTKKGVIVNCETQKDSETLTTLIQDMMGECLHGSEVKGGLPRIVLKKVDKNLDKDVLLERVVTCNEDIGKELGGNEAFKMSLKEKYRVGGRGSNPYVDVVYEVKAATRKLMVGKRISLGWSGAEVLDHFSLLQCYRCWNIGHRSVDCKSKEPVCGYCAEEGHRNTKCRNNGVGRCALCISINKTRRDKFDTRHDVRDAECGAYTSMWHSQRSRIDYGD
ncbi:hypothetical protein RN001_003933 [Aquatica leii]|uniref:CCHC-type domain-containing protein n=1 Tax=Aquatica leii TaxID=1421715 RepID=A0AAN7QA02_9COLE|nr:hypothetical protein RN001_003933 [Aquatica leii]